jgi:hypothetical protein
VTLLPYGGFLIFLVVAGRRAGPFHHHHYFKLLGLKRKEQRIAVEARRWGYTWFGVVALWLQLVPVVQMFFLMSTAVGSALWAVGLEGERKREIREAGLAA